MCGCCIRNFLAITVDNAVSCSLRPAHALHRRSTCPLLPPPTALPHPTALPLPSLQGKKRDAHLLMWESRTRCPPSHSNTCTHPPLISGCTLSDVGAEDEVPTTLAGGGAQDSSSLLEEMAPYANYIIGMLSNYGALPLDRLHSMLGIFVVSPKWVACSLCSKD